MQKPYLPHPHTHTQTDKHIQIITHKRTRIHHTNMHTHREIDRHIQKVAPLRFSLGLRPCTPPCWHPCFCPCTYLPGTASGARAGAAATTTAVAAPASLCTPPVSAPHPNVPTHPHRLSRTLPHVHMCVSVSVCLCVTYVDVGATSAGAPSGMRGAGCSADAFSTAVAYFSSR
jgi:hypothetical protein